MLLEAIFNSKKRGIFLIALFCVGIFLLLPSAFTDASGCKTSNIEGYAWSNNVGWVSFSCLNEYDFGEGVDYGVNVDRSTGVLSGSAWNDNIGWISFSSSDLTGCPDGNCEAKVVSGELTGWAKVVSEEEWISLSGSGYGATYSQPYFSGYAWGDETVGWLSFNCADEGVCGTSNYKVEVNNNRLSVRTDNAIVQYTEGDIDATVKFNGRLLEIIGDPNVDVWFEWGESEDNLDNNSSVQTLTEASAFSSEIIIEDPSAGGVYYFRAVAKNDTGTVRGLIKGFTLFTCNENDFKGYAWADNIGWISFSCTNEYDIGEGVDYGVNIEDSSGLLSGHAWSDVVGWITFNESDLDDCPEGPCEARIEGSNLSGWAKVIGGDDEIEGHEEWISLSGTAENEDEYGVEFIIPEFYGYAWGGGTVGWISFNCVDEGVCTTSDYRVYTTLLTLLVRTDPAVVTYYKDDDSATILLNGMLLGTGSASGADVWFEWSDDYDNLVKDNDTEQTLSSTGAFSSEITISNPEQGDVYYFRAVAESSERKAQGSILSFRISQTDGDIVIKFKGSQKIIEINKEGMIEVLD